MIRTVEDLLSHPLFLLLVGGMLSGVLIPYFTRIWQNRQKEVDLKIKLLIKISESVASIMNAVQKQELEPYLSDDDKSEWQKLKNASPEWERNVASIQAYLSAYFPADSIVESWVSFSGLMSSFYDLSMDPLSRDKNLRRIEDIMSRTEHSKYTDSKLFKISKPFRKLFNISNNHFLTLITFRQTTLRVSKPKT